MSVKTNEIPEVPAALPVAENEDERELFLEREIFGQAQFADDEAAFDEDEENPEDTARLPKPSKKKLFLAFACFVSCFVLLAAAMSWFFGIGFFSAAKTQAVDRTAKPNSAAAPVTEDEKLKMALNLVAEKSFAGQSDPADGSLVSGENAAIDANPDQSVEIPPMGAADLPEPAILPDSRSEQNRSLAVASGNNGNSPATGENRSSSDGGRITASGGEPKGENEIIPKGRSLFFGIERMPIPQVALPSKPSGIEPTDANSAASLTKPAPMTIPFGTLLPIRFLGAVFTLRASGGLVRMELTRDVAGKNYSYPAGTVLVGTLRGSEYKRAFISVAGLIDPKTGGLVKFEGEVIGTDGASGVAGRRRQVKGAWSRVLSGLRDAGAATLGALGNGRSGGTVIISDSTTRASGAITEELSGLAGNKSNSGEFVEIPAGASGFVLVTGLPGEVSGADPPEQDRPSATGLSEGELADLFSEGSPEKIRAALPRMTPAFRRLAERVLEFEER